MSATKWFEGSPHGTATVEELQDFLGMFEKEPRYVFFDFADAVPGALDSYRGYYDHLAFGIDIDWEVRNSSSVLRQLSAALKQPYTGYKGGTYRMYSHTPVWVARWGNASETQIVGAQECLSRIYLVTVNAELEGRP